MYNNKYFNIYFLFFSILFLSSIAFSYDEEKIVVLCLISFVTILYYNFHEIIFNSLNEESLILKNELIGLFSEKIIIMKNLRFCWRIFLDIEDLVIDMYRWVSFRFKKIIKSKSILRLNSFWNYIIKKDINQLFQLKLIIQQNFKFLIFKLLKVKVTTLNKLQLKSLNSLKTLAVTTSIKHFIFNKLNVKCLNIHTKNNYNTYFYLKF